MSEANNLPKMTPEQVVAKLLDFFEREAEEACREATDRVGEAIRNRLCYVLLEARRIAGTSQQPDGQANDYLEHSAQCEKHGFYSWIRECPYCEFNNQ